LTRCDASTSGTSISWAPRDVEGHGAERRKPRAATAAASLLLVTLFVFFLIHLAPGDPVDLLLGPELEPETRDDIRRNWGLDQPLGVQYLRYLERVVLHFDLGHSIRSGHSVADEILTALPNTLQLSLAALLLQLVVGIGLGVLSAVKQNSPLDRISRVTSLTVYSVPSFYLGLILLFLFAGGIQGCRLFPAGGMIDPVDYELQLAQAHTITRSIRTVLVHPGLPADNRHGSHIGRGELAKWAEQKMQS